MLKESYPFYLANKAVQPNTDLKVIDKFTGEVATRVAMASPDHIDQAIVAAVKVQPTLNAMPAYERQAVLHHCVERFTERFEELAQAYICLLKYRIFLNT